MKQVSGNKFKVIGVMSGTSLDGLDLAAVEFENQNGKWNFKLAATETVPYTEDWNEKLLNASTLSGVKLTMLDIEYGWFIASEINAFIKKTGFTPELIASHGHTVFHQPEKGFTLQIGNGYEIASNTKIKSVADFRSLDVSLGGQGAPLVPIGDILLFSEFDYCLNLGGFSNISFEKEGKRMAFDICPVNMVLNRMAEKLGFPFDDEGKMGRNGHINSNLLNTLNSLPYYNEPPPKSLGREWMEANFFPALDFFAISEVDKLRTVYEHIAIEIALVANEGKLLLTGGGALNTFLVERIQSHTDLKIVVPEKQIINYKEALIFAFLGVLRILEKNNCLSSVTGAKRDSCCGTIFSS